MSDLQLFGGLDRGILLTGQWPWWGWMLSGQPGSSITLTSTQLHTSEDAQVLCWMRINLLIYTSTLAWRKINRSITESWVSVMTSYSLYGVRITIHRFMANKIWGKKHCYFCVTVMRGFLITDAHLSHPVWMQIGEADRSQLTSGQSESSMTRSSP